MSGPGGMPNGSGSKKNRLHGLMLHPDPMSSAFEWALPLRSLLSGTSKVTGPVSGSQQVGGRRDLERYWSPQRLPSSLWHVRGLISAKRRLERSKFRVDMVTWKVWKKCGTCARMHVAVSGLSVGS